MTGATHTAACQALDKGARTGPEKLDLCCFAKLRRVRLHAVTRCRVVCRCQNTLSNAMSGLSRPLWLHALKLNFFCTSFASYWILFPTRPLPNPHQIFYDSFIVLNLMRLR